MFKKKVLSSLLAMSMVFSTGSFAGAEETTMSRKDCKKRFVVLLKIRKNKLLKELKV